MTGSDCLPGCADSPGPRPRTKALPAVPTSRRAREVGTAGSACVLAAAAG
ncbi:hypothetical protein ACFPRL_14645 [Pseudoclavibacter helvolus]